MIKNLAPDIFRKRLLLEGYYMISIDEHWIRKYLDFICVHLNVHMYNEPIVFSTGDSVDSDNAGYDAFVPLFDSGIACYFWTKKKFLSIIFYTCKDFDDAKAVEATKEWFQMNTAEWEIF